MVRPATLPLRNLLHRWAHRLGLQRGDIVSGWSGGALWIGFRCAWCGQVTGAHVSETSRRDGHTGPPPTVWTR